MTSVMAAVGIVAAILVGIYGAMHEWPPWAVVLIAVVTVIAFALIGLVIDAMIDASLAALERVLR